MSMDDLVTDENPINVGLNYNFTLLEMVKNLLRIKGEIETGRGYVRRKAYMNFKDGLESILFYLVWSSRYDDSFLSKKLEILNSQDKGYSKENFDILKNTLFDIAKEVKKKSPLDRDVKWGKIGEVMSKSVK